MKKRWISIAAAAVLAFSAMTAAAAENGEGVMVRVGSLKLTDLHGTCLFDGR